MANIELHERLFGGGLVGTIDVPSRPTLSWADSRALQAAAMNSAAAAASAQVSASNTAATFAAVQRLGWGVGAVAAAVAELGDSLGYALADQTAVMERQAAELAAIHDTLMTPAKTRAAERIADAGVLLGRGRYDRALAFAEEAIDLSPINPYGFDAAGWAHLGLGDMTKARECFEEAADGTEGDERSGYFRRAARLAYVIGDTAGAAGLLSNALAGEISEPERLRVLYDVAIYAAALGSHDEAKRAMTTVCEADWRFGGVAAVDRALDDFTDVRDVALERAAAARRAGADRRDSLDARLEELGAAVPAEKFLLPDDDPWRTARERAIAAIRAGREAIAAADAVDDAHWEDRGGDLDAAETETDAAAAALAQVIEGAEAAEERNGGRVLALVAQLPAALVHLPSDDPWALKREHVVARLERVRIALADAQSATVLTPAAREEARQAATEVAATEIPVLLAELNGELAAAQKRNEEGRDAFDRVLRSSKPRQRKRGLLDRLKDL